MIIIKQGTQYNNNIHICLKLLVEK